MRCLVQGLLRRGGVRAGGEINLDIFPDMNAGDAGIAHMGQGVLNGFALRIEHGFLRGDDDFGFHVRPQSLRFQVCSFK